MSGQASDNLISGKPAYSKDEFDYAGWLVNRRMDCDGSIKKLRDKRNAAKRRRLNESPSRRVRNAMSARMWAALRGKSDGALFSKLSYSVEELKKHIELLFTDGMSWENYGKWHIDHKKPCSLFDLMDSKQFSECWSLDNLQPLWAGDNCKKGAYYAST